MTILRVIEWPTLLSAIDCVPYAAPRVLLVRNSVDLRQQRDKEKQNLER